MSYDATPDYARETLLKNRLDALLKPTVGKLYDKNAPGYLRNDNETDRFRYSASRKTMINDVTPIYGLIAHLDTGGEVEERVDLIQ